MSQAAVFESSDARLRRAHKRALWRLLPFLCLLLFVANSDRSAIAYGAPAGMNAELGIDAATFGLVSAVFFFGYVFFEIPSSMLMYRFGATKWIGRIIITWGIVQALTAFVPNEWLLGGLRVLLGICEAGFTPCVLFYLTLWFPVRVRSWAFGIYFATIPVTAIIGGPIMGALIQLGDGLEPFGLSGWRFMFLVTGVVPFLLGVLTLFVLPSGPDAVSWLSSEEKSAVQGVLRREQTDIPHSSHARIWQALADWRPWVLGIAYISVPFAAYATTFFLPTMVTNFSSGRGFELNPVQVSLVVAVPSVFGLLAVLAASRLMVRRPSHGLWVLILALVGAVGALTVTLSSDPIMMLAGLSILGMCTGAIPVAVFSILPKQFATATAATAIALVNSLCNLGGFFGPYVTGGIIGATGSETLPFVVMSGLLVIGGVVMYLIDRFARPRRTADVAPSASADRATAGDVA